MKEEEKLLNLDLEKEQEKQSLEHPKGLKLYFFRTLYFLIHYKSLNYFCDILFTIFEFIQLMAFPMDKIFSSGWKTFWYGTIGNFFCYFHLVTLWMGNTQIYLITYILTCLYIFLLLISFIHIFINSTSLSYKPKIVNKIISILLDFEIILNIPFLKTLFSAFNCENDNLRIANNIKCKNGIHLSLIVISTIFILIFEILMLLFRSTLFEFGKNNGKFKAAYTFSTEVVLSMTKLILTFLYQFFINEMALSIITFIISLIIFIDFLDKQPFSNGLTMKLYFGLYLLFFWSSTICIIALLLRNSKFEGGILLLIVGYPLIIISVLTTEWEFSFDKIFQFLISKEKDSYKALLEIEYFLKMEDSLEDKIRTKEQKVLYSYISNYEKNCSLNICPLKQFMDIPLKVENFVEMKICLLQHGEILYKHALSKFPFYTKLRLSYGLFLYNKLNKKLQGTNEIALLNKYSNNLEDSFLVYKTQRYIQEENERLSNTNNKNNSSQEKNTNYVNSFTYKSALNNIKSLIRKITLNYIDFWTILAMSDENQSENFHKMSKIGIKISSLNEELKANVEKLETINLYDQDTFKLYIQYLIEILSNNAKANIYNNKLSENEQKKHQYNEENLYELNYKEMSRSEDYKFFIVDCSQSNFDKICNLSLSVCPLFGYTKDELIGYPFEYLLPELFSIYHKKMLKNKVDEFKKKLLIKNIKSRSESWTNDPFGRTKMKYLIPVKIKWTLISSEDEIIYGIGKIITDNKTINELEEEVIYILTDKNLIIQNFTSNAPKLLFLHSTAISNNLDITDFIKEFNEENISNIDNNDDIRESVISNMSIIKRKKRYAKIEILKKMFLAEKDSKKLIHWKLGEIITNESNNINKKNGKNIGRKSFVRVNYNEPCIENPCKHFKNVTINVSSKRKISVEHINEYETTTNKRRLTSSLTDENLANIDPEKILDLKDTNISDLNIDGSLIANDKILKDKIFYHRPVHHKFYLSVKEVEINELKVGYIFKFETCAPKNIEQGNVQNTHKNNQNVTRYELSPKTKPEYNEIEKSDISVISFSTNKQALDKRNSYLFNSLDNPFGINPENNDSFFLKQQLEKEKEFTIDMGKMSYKQFGINDKSEELNLYDILRQEAIEKISEAARQVKKEDLSEDEEESSSVSYYSSGDENSNNSEIDSEGKNDEQSSHHSIKKINSQENKTSQKNESKLDLEKKKNFMGKDNIPIISPENTNNFNPINPINNNLNNKNKQEDYYHVNVSNITYYIYNYSSGFVEVLKDQKYKISEVVKKTNAEKEKLSKMNAKYISNPKLAKEKKSGNLNKKMINDDDELNSYNRQSFKLKEIQKALTSKEKQSSIINLCVFSFIVFFLIIGTSIMSIMINYYLKDKTFLFYYLIKNSIQLYQNLLVEITFVRELIIMNSTYYNNFYDPDIFHYYKNISTSCYEYYLDSALILSNLATNINILNERQKNKLSNYSIYCYVLDPIESHGLSYRPKRYELPIFSAYMEINAALYHISQITMEEIYTYEDNVYYFLKNGMSNLLIYLEIQIELLTKEFDQTVKNGHKIIFICLASLFVIYFGCFFLFNHFYQKVEERKQSYLSVFYEIGGQFIILSLAKCEKFSQKLQIQEDNIGNQPDKMSLDSCSIDDSYIDSDIQTSSIIKQNKQSKIISVKKEKKEKNSSFLKAKIIGFIIFFILMACQYCTYIYYYLRLSLYNNGINYEYHLTNYISSFLFPFIGIREYIYDTQKTFYNTPVGEYINDTLEKFYTELVDASNRKDKYVKYFPNSYIEYLNYLYSEHICELINEFANEYRENGFTNCKDFFYDSSDYGFFSILTIYIEEIRMMRDKIDDYIEKSKQKNFTYNESFYNHPGNLYEEIYAQNEDKDYYRKLNPANTLSSPSHKNLLIVYRFVITKVIILAIKRMFLAFEGVFSDTNKASLIINILFILVVSLGFLLIWIPLVLKQNETIYKTKNMLSIIPNEILISLPHINIMLGINEDNN